MPDLAWARCRKNQICIPPGDDWICRDFLDARPNAGSRPRAAVWGLEPGLLYDWVDVPRPFATFRELEAPSVEAGVQRAGDLGWVAYLKTGEPDCLPPPGERVSLRLHDEVIQFETGVIERVVPIPGQDLMRRRSTVERVKVLYSRNDGEALLRWIDRKYDSRGLLAKLSEPMLGWSAMELWGVPCFLLVARLGEDYELRHWVWDTNARFLRG